MRRKVIAAVAALALSAGVAACGVGNDESREDATDIQRCAHEGEYLKCNDAFQPNGVAFNNKYPNVEDKCDGYGHRIYVITDDGTQPIVLPDPTCPGFVRGEEPPVVAAG